MGDAMPMLRSNRDGSVRYDRISEESIICILPQLAELYCYSSNRTNLIAGIKIRYPEDRACLDEDFAPTYARFVLNSIRNAPYPLIIDHRIDDVPLQYSG